MINFETCIYLGLLFSLVGIYSFINKKTTHIASTYGLNRILWLFSIFVINSSFISLLIQKNPNINHAIIGNLVTNILLGNGLMIFLFSKNKTLSKSATNRLSYLIFICLFFCIYFLFQDKISKTVGLCLILVYLVMTVRGVNIINIRSRVNYISIFVYMAVVVCAVLISILVVILNNLLIGTLQASKTNYLIYLPLVGLVNATIYYFITVRNRNLSKQVKYLTHLSLYNLVFFPVITAFYVGYFSFSKSDILTLSFLILCIIITSFKKSFGFINRVFFVLCYAFYLWIFI